MSSPARGSARLSAIGVPPDTVADEDEQRGRQRVSMLDSQALVAISAAAQTQAASRSVASFQRLFYALAALNAVLTAVAAADALQRAAWASTTHGAADAAAFGGVLPPLEPPWRDEYGQLAIVELPDTGLFMPEYSYAGEVRTSVERDLSAGVNERRWLTGAVPPPYLSTNRLAAQLAVTLALLSLGCAAALRRSPPLLTLYAAAASVWTLARLASAGPLAGTPGLLDHNSATGVSGVDPGGSGTLAFALRSVCDLLCVLAAYRLRASLSPAWFASVRTRFSLL